GGSASSSLTFAGAGGVTSVHVVKLAGFPSSPMYSFFGENPVGPWTLTIFDRFAADVGTLDGWGLQICTQCFDSDFDGDCDAQDPGNSFGGQDFLSPPRSRLQLSRVNVDPAPDNDTLSLTGVFVPPAGKTFADLRPDLRGAPLRTDARAAGPR